MAKQQKQPSQSLYDIIDKQNFQKSRLLNQSSVSPQPRVTLLTLVYWLSCFCCLLMILRSFVLWFFNSVVTWLSTDFQKLGVFSPNIPFRVRRIWLTFRSSSLDFPFNPLKFESISSFSLKWEIKRYFKDINTWLSTDKAWFLCVCLYRSCLRRLVNNAMPSR